MRPRSPEEAADLAAAIAQFNDENAEWSPERATRAFWHAFQLAGAEGVKVSKLVTLCHRKDTWVHTLRKKAQEDLAIVPIKTGSQFYKLTTLERVPEEYRIPIDSN